MAEPKGRAADDRPRLRLSDQYCLAERRATFKEGFAVCDEQSAIGQMTRSLVLEWGKYGVRVDALASGFILTDLTKKLWENPGMQKWERHEKEQP